MKKRLAALMLVVATMFSLTACGKFTCDSCGEEKTGKSHKESLFGIEMIMCDDCYQATQAAMQLFGM